MSRCCTRRHGGDGIARCVEMESGRLLLRVSRAGGFVRWRAPERRRLRTEMLLAGAGTFFRDCPAGRRCHAEHARKGYTVTVCSCGDAGR